MAGKTFHVYTWMEDELRRLIVSGLLPENRPIWSESVLMQKYSIGRNAVRTAIGHLEEEGLLKRVHAAYEDPERAEQSLRLDLRRVRLGLQKDRLLEALPGKRL